MFEVVMRPIIALVLFTIAYVIAQLLRKLIPEGRVKEWLYRKHDVIPPPEYFEARRLRNRARWQKLVRAVRRLSGHPDISSPSPALTTARASGRPRVSGRLSYSPKG
jgi:hypothetical protein